MVLELTEVSVRNGVIDPAGVILANAIEAMKLPIVTGSPLATAAVDDELNGVGQYGLAATRA